MAWLTKSRFLSGLQCHKRLWFEVHQPIETAAAPSTAILQGRRFDEAVQRLHPGTIVSRARGLPAAIAATTKLLGKGAKGPATLYQPAIRAGDLAVIADVLRRQGNAFELIEIKGTTQVKEAHVPDAAFQALVLQRAKIPVSRVFLGHVNNQFVLHRAGDYDGLLVEVDITDSVAGYQREAAERAVELQQVMASDSMPAVEVGPHCMSPHECPFHARCTARHEPPPYAVQSLPRGGTVVDELLAEGFRDLRDVPLERLSNDLHRRVHDATVSGLAFFDQRATAELRELTCPFAYLDFETIGSSVPEIIGTRPYEQVPFQWSVHVEQAPDDIRHAEYLAIESFGDFGALAGELIRALPPAGPIFAYNASFEARVLLRLAEWTPTHAAGLHDIAGRLIDLLAVTRAAYYHRDMQGSWSIKNVMPTIDAALAYARLDEVQEGDGAQQAFLELRGPTLSPGRDALLRSALLRYCRHDTWVMVVLRRFLCGEPLGAEVEL
jgi:hypothetical protein